MRAEAIDTELATKVFGIHETAPEPSPEEISLEYNVALEIAERHCNITGAENELVSRKGAIRLATRSRRYSPRFAYNGSTLRLAIYDEPTYLGDDTYDNDDRVVSVRIKHVEDDDTDEETHADIGAIYDDFVSTSKRPSSKRQMLDDVMDCITEADIALSTKHEKKRPKLLQRAGAILLRHLKS